LIFVMGMWYQIFILREVHSRCMFPAFLDITGSGASFTFNDLKFHRGARSDGSITLPRKRGKVKEDIFA